MAESNEDTEKEHEPSQKKLDDARKKGDIPKSVDLITASGYGGLLIAMIAIGSSTLGDLSQLFASMLDKSDSLAVDWLSGAGTSLSAQLILASGVSLIGWFVFPFIAVIAAILAQQAFVVAPDKLIPKASRISPLSNVKNKFGRAGLFEFFKSFLKLLIYSFFLGVFLYWNVDEIVANVNFEPATVLISLSKLTVEFLAIVLVIAATLGTIDLVFQKKEHVRKNRMSRKEMTDESKESEGDPHMKQERRQRGLDIATNQMLSDVPEADVVVVNPTHFAVALKWARTPGSAPKCVAKGVDEVAAKIREIANENAIPIHSDPPTARALFASVEIGDEVAPDHYEAVAAAIRFAESLRKKAREQK